MTQVRATLNSHHLTRLFFVKLTILILERLPNNPEMIPQKSQATERSPYIKLHRIIQYIFSSMYTASGENVTTDMLDIRY